MNSHVGPIIQLTGIISPCLSETYHYSIHNSRDKFIVQKYKTTIKQKISTNTHNSNEQTMLRKRSLMSKEGDNNQKKKKMKRTEIIQPSLYNFQDTFFTLENVAYENISILCNFL